jgi:hypothetical protein
MPDVGMQRAAERVTLACKALSAAANDLRVEYSQYKMTAVVDAAQMVEAETERVCELAEELTSLATNLRGLSVFAAAAEPAD